MIEVGIGKSRGCMAGGAVLVRRDVRGINLRIFAGRIDAVMAGRAVARDPGMIKHRRCECATGSVADTAILAGCHVIGFRVLARGIHAVVAAVTPAAYHFRTRMIHEGIGEAARVVASGAVATGVPVNGRIRFARSPQRHESR